MARSSVIEYADNGATVGLVSGGLPPPESATGVARDGNCLSGEGCCAVGTSEIVGTRSGNHDLDGAIDQRIQGCKSGVD